jgi:hypothetical protein
MALSGGKEMLKGAFQRSLDATNTGNKEVLKTHDKDNAVPRHGVSQTFQQMAEC